MVWVPATGRSRGLGRPARTCKLFPAVVARSVQHCSARVLLPSCGGGGGRWVPATRAGGSETPKLSAGSWKGQREGRILENSSAVRGAPGKARGTRDSQPPSATYVQRTVLLARAAGQQRCYSKPPPGGRCGAHAPGARSPNSNQPSGSHSAETFCFPRDGEQGRSGHTLMEFGDRGQQRGVWTDQSFVAAGR